MRRLILSLIVVLGVAAASCSDDGTLTVPTGSSSPAATTTTIGPETTTTAAAPAGTTTTTRPPSTTTTTTTEAPPTALDSLRSFFVAAEDLDARIRDAAQAFNDGLDSEAVTIDPAVGPILDALDATPLRYTIPPGLSPELEVAVLAVFADLDSRISSLQGGWRNIAHSGNLEWGLDCLSNGGASADRFPDDLERARETAGLEPVPSATPDSIAAGVLMVRLEAIQSMNWGCDSCGGVQYDEAIPVYWEDRTLLDGVGFEATFDGEFWDVAIYAC